MKALLQKYISQLLLILTIVGLGFFAYRKAQDSKQADRLHQELVGTKEKYEQLNAHTAKLESDYKTQKDLAVTTAKRFSEVAQAKDEQIKMLSDATYLLSKHVGKQTGPDYFFETPKKTQNYAYNEVRLAGPDSPPIGFVMIKSDGATYKGNYSFEIRVETLQTVDEATGKIKVYSKAYLVAKENGLAQKRRPDFKTWAGVDFPLDIVGGTALIDPTVARTDLKHVMWWAPRINGGLNVGFNRNGSFIRPALDFSVAGYGRSRNDLDWKFLQMGIGLNGKFKDPDLHAMPFTYRPFPSILTNTYFGPGVGWSSVDSLEYFLNTSVSF